MLQGVEFHEESFYISLEIFIAIEDLITKLSADLTSIILSDV